MKKAGYSVSVFWDGRAVLKDTELSRIMITINLTGSKQFRITVKLYSTKEDFEKAMSGSGGSTEVKELRREINNYVLKAENILDRMPTVTKESFTRLFKSETDLFSSDKTDMYFLYEEMIETLMKEERIGYAGAVKCSLSSFKTYKSELYCEDINESFLNGYKSWMLAKGCSITTIQIYLRSLKTILNKAIKDGLVSEKHNGFKNYPIGTSARSKSVLYPIQLKALWEYEPINIRESKAKDYFFFCYLCNGMNFKDVVFLKNSNIVNDMLYFVREKTKRTNSVANKQIKVYLRPEVKAIIKRLGNETNDQDDYVFPVLNGCKTVLEKEKAKTRHSKTVNKALKKIGNKLGFNVTLYINLARHSFATTLKMNGTTIEFISDAMGHSTSKTTASYLKSLPDDSYRKMSESLLNF